MLQAGAQADSLTRVRTWFVLYLKPRCEKKTADHCVRLEVPHYLPLRSETKVFQRRRVTVAKPVFPGYLFVAFDDRQRIELLKTNHIVRILEPAGRRELLHQLAQIRKALRIDPSLGAAAALTRGRAVRIRGGPFLGVDGRIEALRGETEVWLNVDILGQAVKVKIERALIEVLD